MSQIDSCISIMEKIIGVFVSCFLFHLVSFHPKEQSAVTEDDDDICSFIIYEMK
jgi:hypothetical protein